MIPELLKKISALQGELFLFVEDGPLKNKLLERYMDGESAHADNLESDLEGSIRICWRQGAQAPVIEGRLEADGFLYQTLFFIGDFDEAETAQLLAELKSKGPVPMEKEDLPGRNILRKKVGSGLMRISEASKALGLSPRSLKALIPCSEVRIVGEGGDRAIEEYYWEKELIDRFEALWAAQTQGHLPDSLDLSFIAERCCDSDLQWARDCIAGFLQQRNLRESRPPE